jgi:hypothetical protein
MSHSDGSIIGPVLDIGWFGMKCHQVAMVINQRCFNIGAA